MNDIDQWGIDWSIPPQAMADLRARMLPQPSEANGKSEAHAQSLIRLEAHQKGMVLMRNNVGALPDKRGVPVRYGLMNDSAELNRRVKSADLIGIERVTITPLMVGTVIGRFMSVECKPAGWRYTGDEHETAQMQWATLVNAWGGRAVFATGPNDI